MRALLVVVVVTALLVLSPGASAGPPAKVCRHVSARECEQILGPYAAAQFLGAYVFKNVVPRLTIPVAGVGIECGPTKHHRRSVFRCGATVHMLGPSSPCKVEALVARDKSKVFRFDWLQESAACKP
jgi:hypothetical protein